MNLGIVLERYTEVYPYNNGVIDPFPSYKEDQEEYSLDLFENEPIKINYQVIDSENPETKLAPYSQTFLIPGTSNNLAAFKWPNLISSDEAYDDYVGYQDGNTWKIRKQEALILQDGVQVQRGRMLMNYCETKEGEIQSMEVAFFSTTVSLFDELGAKKLWELNYELPDLNDVNGVQECMINRQSDGTFSFGGTEYSGWTLAYPDWGFLGPTGENSLGGISYNTADPTFLWQSTPTPPSDPASSNLLIGQNLLPYAYVRDIIKRIFEGTTKRLKSDFMDTPEFKSLLLLYFDNYYKPRGYGFRIAGNNPNPNEFYEDHFQGESYQDVVKVDVNNFVTTGRIDQAAQFDQGLPLYDDLGFWNADEGCLIFPEPGYYEVSMKFWANIQFGWDMITPIGPTGTRLVGDICPGSPLPAPPNAFNPYDYDAWPLLGDPMMGNSQLFIEDAMGNPVGLPCNLGLAITSRDIYPYPGYYDGTATPSYYTKNGNQHLLWQIGYKGYNPPHYNNPPYTVGINVTTPGEKYYIKASFDSAKYRQAPYQNVCNPFITKERLYKPSIDVEVFITQTTLNPIWRQTLPDITQAEFLKMIIKHFNLYTEVDPQGFIRMEPRGYFYDYGDKKDFSAKINLATPRKMTRTDGIKRVEARMKATDNLLDKLAQDTSKDKLEWGSNIYLYNRGQITKEINSDFGSLTVDKAQGFVTKYKTIFGGIRIPYVATTPLKVKIGATGYNVPVPSLYAVGKDGTRELTETSDIFIGFHNGVYENPTLGITGPTAYSYFGGTTVVGQVIGASGNPGVQIISPWSAINNTSTDVIDLHYTPSPSTLYDFTLPPSVATASNAYARYWEPAIKATQGQKKYNLEIRLTASDMADFSLRDNIYIEEPTGDGAWFLINKVEYEWGNPGWSPIELIEK